MTELKRSQTEKPKIIGVDLHPDSFSAVQVSGMTAATLNVERTFTKVDCKEWAHFVQRQIPAGSTLVCEAGSNSFEMMKIGKQAGHKTVVLNSVSVGRIAKAYCKTDKLDSLKLARVYLCELAEGIWEPDEETLLKRKIFSSYGNAQTDVTRCSNRIKSFLCSRNIRIKEKLRKSDIIIADIKKKYNWSADEIFILEEMFNDLNHAKAKLEKHKTMIYKTVLGNQNMAKLMNLCGIRMIGAYSLISAIGDIERFKTPKKLVAYLGLAPAIKASGNSKWSCGMQHGGRTEVKSILIEGANAVLKSKNATGKALRTWGYALSKRKDKCVAIAGIARKLAVAVWYVMKGLMPDIIEGENDIKAKMQKVAQEVTIKTVKKIGYNKVSDFVEEYTILLLSRSTEVTERWKSREKAIFPTK